MFRKLKNKKLTKIIILVTIFIIVILFLILFDFGPNSKKTVSIDTSTLPVIYSSFEGFDLNILYGNTQEMDPAFMRDSITPIKEDYTIDLKIKECPTDITSISFEVKSLNSENLIQSTQVNSWEKDGSTAKVNLKIENIIEKDVEYILIVKITTPSHENIRYYTRILMGSESYYKNQVDFVKQFSDWTFDAEESENILSYLDVGVLPVDNSNLGLVTINSRTSTVEWGGLSPVKVTEPSITIKEIIEDVACIQLKYVIYTQNGDTKEYYNVTEFYRVRMAEPKMKLLDFNREMQQIFEPTEENVTKKTINLGIDSDQEVELKTDITGNYVSFVNEGALWCMDISTNEITKIFSFSGAKDTDVRKTNDQHNIKMISVSENGDMDFLVYGYMNSGEHEGSVGIALYNYKKQSGEVEELLYIPSNRSFEIIDKMLGELLYVSDSGSLFLILDNYIYSIDLSGKEYVELASGISIGNYVVSYDQSMIAWHENSSINNADKITVLSLETGKSCRVKAKESTKIKALGFLENDFVYGTAKIENINQDTTAENNFLMDNIKVIDLDENVQQEETGDGMLFTGAITGYNSVVLKRVKLNANLTAYEAKDDLTIFSFGEREAITTVEKSTDEFKKTILIVTFLDRVKTGEALSKKQVDKVLFENTNSLSVRKMSSIQDRYYVYSKGGVSGIYSSLSLAIVKADAEMGVVIDDSQNYVWIRGARKTAADIVGISIPPTPDKNKRLGVCIQELLEINGINDIDVEKQINAGKTSINILDESLKDRGVYLKGITVNQGLYFVSKGQPLIGILNGDDCIMIIGYDSKNVTLLSPENGVPYEVTLEQAEAMFEAAANRFITLLDK